MESMSVRSPFRVCPQHDHLLSVSGSSVQGIPITNEQVKVPPKHKRKGHPDFLVLFKHPPESPQGMKPPSFKFLTNSLFLFMILIFESWLCSMMGFKILLGS